MTDDMMNVRSLVEKSADADLSREMICFAAERLMALEVGNATGADFGEKSPLGSASDICDKKMSDFSPPPCSLKSQEIRDRAHHAG